MVERAYGPGEVPGGDDWCSELGHGWFNVAYRMRLQSGREVVLKIAPPPHIEVMTYERGAMATELAALRLIREQTAVPVPVVDFADQSHELCDADYFFMEYVDADNLGMLRDQHTVEERAACNEALGALNRSLVSRRLGAGDPAGAGGPWATGPPVFWPPQKPRAPTSPKPAAPPRPCPGDLTAVAEQTGIVPARLGRPGR
jgi:hypothetical protein